MISFERTRAHRYRVVIPVSAAGNGIVSGITVASSDREQEAIAYAAYLHRIAPPIFAAVDSERVSILDWQGPRLQS